LWLVVPVAMPALISVVASPLYNTRYVIAASLPFLLFAAAGIVELPQLPRGKGVQTIKIHRTPIAPEKVVAVAVLPREGTLVVVAGKRYTNLKPADLETYLGKRAQRGLKLPRGFQNVSTIRAWSDRDRTETVN